jgi:hypothetical protein
MSNNMAKRISILMILFLSACNLQNVGAASKTNSEKVATIVVLTVAAIKQTMELPPVTTLTLEQANKTQTGSFSSTRVSTFPLTPNHPNKTQTASLAPTSVSTVTQTPAMTPISLITLTLGPTETPIPKPGTIVGSISGYPYGNLPKLAVVAYGQDPPYNYSYWLTTAGNSYYSMTSSYLIPGNYQVVAYDSRNHTGGCPKIVTVTSDQAVKCDITDWGGGYRAKPSGVPDP